MKLFFVSSMFLVAANIGIANSYAQGIDPKESCHQAVAVMAEQCSVLFGRKTQLPATEPPKEMVTPQRAAPAPEDVELPSYPCVVMGGCCVGHGTETCCTYVAENC